MSLTRSIRDVLRPIYSAIFRRGVNAGAASASSEIPANLPPFDTYLYRERPNTRLSTFKPRYPFGLERGVAAKAFYSTDPNSPFGHEPELAHLLDLLASNDAVFLDVGANNGHFSIYLGTRADFKGRIHAFEPIPDTFAALRTMVDTLRCGDVVTCYQAAASDSVGTASMDLGGHAGLASIKEGSLENGVAVPTLTLDSLKLPRVDFLKVDVEGHEINVLRGADELIKAHKPYIFLESWTFEDDPQKGFEPLQFLIDRGYKLYLPAWAQSNGTFFVGIGAGFEMKNFALVPFTFADRLTFPGNPINIFAAPLSKEAKLGDLYSVARVKKDAAA
jgi:FkbM family methyltransferase